jgi:pimeloyl-ACP methyl ester carboxylesterase
MNALTEKFITVADVETHLRVGGNGEPLLFLHGGGTADIWLPFHEELAHRHTVYAPDHPGFGRSAMPDWLDAMEDLVIHYATMLDELKLSRVNLAGFSLGGWIAAEFASFYPERVNRLALISAAGLRVAGAPITDIFALGPEELAMVSFHDISKAMVLMGDMSDPLGRFLQDYRERTMMARLAWNPGYSPKLARRLRRITAPTLIIWGKDDRLIPSAHGEAYRSAIANARLELLPDCGHLPIVECADQTAQLLSDFFAKERER